ncbi:hypothetical protein HanXRQr2_Chr13g0594841 [Helianthus annuus]|uniref:Uncharacterized protein n=1 Tax=Helianthus annuus TaxID=4232 RepID=A0A9K3EHP5_HELAN|nr:hypothetical protein HanXRQr2_Chr13g0594841 [Helianthus annuus]
MYLLQSLASCSWLTLRLYIYSTNRKNLKRHSQFCCLLPFGTTGRICLKSPPNTITLPPTVFKNFLKYHN